MKQNRKQRNMDDLQVTGHLDRGFTLVEIMVAIVVLSIGFFAAASMLISAVDTASSVDHITESTNLAQSRLEELMALEYTEAFTDPDLIEDTATAEGSEPFIDSNGNGFRDYEESFTDSNNNGIWDAAHVGRNPQPGYIITWSVLDAAPATPEKHIRVYVTRCDNRRTTTLTCIKPRR